LNKIFRGIYIDRVAFWKVDVEKEIKTSVDGDYADITDGNACPSVFLGKVGSRLGAVQWETAAPT
jgi:hypothetical protein